VNSKRLKFKHSFRRADKMEAMGQLATGIAHDLNNALAVIQGHAGLLNVVLSPEGPHRKSTDEICKAAVRAGNLTRQLLLFSGKQVMQFQTLDLKTVIDNLTSMLRSVAGESILIEIMAEPDLPKVDLDSSMIEQVLVSLTAIASDAMPLGGKIAIYLEACEIRRGPTDTDPQARHGCFVCLRFSDEGRGRDNGAPGWPFEPCLTAKEPGNSIGLGLATVDGIVEQHQGWIEIESAAGGTALCIYLPVSARNAQSLDEFGTQQSRTTGTETILIAEDEPAIREMVAEVLSTHGYTVLQASSGQEALRLWEGKIHCADLLLTDMVMPGGITGAELARSLRELNPRLKVVYSSGYSPASFSEGLALCDGSNFLPKPYSLTKLASVVRRCLDSPTIAY